MAYVSDPSLQKLTFLINLNGTNSYKQEFYLPLPITGFRYVSLHSTQFFAVSTTFAGIGYVTDFYNPDTTSQQISGLIIANDIVKSLVTSNTISSLQLSLKVPITPTPNDVFQGVLVFSN